MSSVSPPYDAGPTYGTGVYDPATVVPLPVTTLAAVPAHQVTYLFCDTVTGTLIARLPLTKVTFGYMLNSAGRFSGTLAVEDPRVAALDWTEAVQENKCSVWVDIDGVLVWGGMISNALYDDAAQTVQVTANDWVGYLGQREQAADYATNWVTAAAAPMAMAETVLSDTFGVANSAPLSVVTEGTTPSQYFVTTAFPSAFKQTTQMIVQMLAGMGYNIGFDYAADVAYKSGYPSAQITLSYPRRGRIAGSTGLVVSVTRESHFTWQADGSQQAISLTEMSTGTAGVGVEGTWDPALTQDGYPLVERVISHTAMTSTPENQAALEATVQGDLSVYAYPPVTATVTVPLFGWPAWGDYIVGDDIRLIVPAQAGAGMPPTCPRFPKGLDTYLRISQIDVTIADEGLSTSKLTLQMPPGSVPQRPPS